MIHSLHSRYDVFDSNEALCLILIYIKSLGWARNPTSIIVSHSSGESFQQGVQQCQREWLCDEDKTRHSAATGPAQTHPHQRLCPEGDEPLDHNHPQAAGDGAREAIPLLRVLWLLLTATAAGGGRSVLPAETQKALQFPS